MVLVLVLRPIFWVLVLSLDTYGLGLGLGLVSFSLGLGLGLEPCGLVNITELRRAEKMQRGLSLQQRKKQKECANDINDSECQNEIFRMTKQMVKEKQDKTGLNCIKGATGKVIVDDKGIKNS